jgi:parvulin-like peptidyl-prolyl isomerase
MMLRVRRSSIAWMFLAAAAGGMSALAAPEEPATVSLPQRAAVENGNVVARVNGEAILVEDIERELGRLHGSVQKEERRGFDVDRLMFKIINDVLLGQEARALGMDEDESIAAQVGAFRSKQIIRKLQREEVDDRAEPTEEEVQKTFQEQYRRITFRVVTAYDRDGAEALLSELRDGADMERLARERSVDPYAIREGLVSDISRIDLQNEIADMAFSLESGQIGGPVRTDLGWTLIRVESKRAADPAQFERVESSVRRLVRHLKGKELRASLAAGVRERHRVVIDDDVVKGVRPKRLPDSRLIPEYDDPAAMVARVGKDQGITTEEYAKGLLARWGGVRNEAAAVASAPIILENLIEKKLLLAEARDRGYADDPRVVRSVRLFETGLLVQRYLEEVIGDDVEVGVEEMKDYYDAHQDEFKMPPRLSVGQITVETPEEAERIAGLLRDGADLGWLAKRHSIDRFRDTGGNRGWMTPRTGVDEIHRRLLEAEVGDVLDPLGSPGNYVVLKLLARKASGIYPFDEVSGNVRNALFSQKFRKTLDEFITKLRSRSEIEIDEERLARLNITGSIEERSGDERKPHDDID